MRDLSPKRSVWSVYTDSHQATIFFNARTAATRTSTEGEGVSKITQRRYKDASPTGAIMATHLRDDISVEELADTMDELTAGVELDEDTKHLSPTWLDFTKRADTLKERQEKLDRRLRRARIGVLVRDGRWDPEEAAFGRAVVDATGGKRDRDPYLRFFREYTPSSAQDQAPEKEIVLAAGWIQELQRVPNDPLATPWVARLESVTKPLAQAIQERNDADKEQAPIDIEKRSLIQEINTALDFLEGELLKLFPGQSKRISAFLSPTRPSRTTRAAKPTTEKA
jgi:hypothetical protein